MVNATSQLVHWSTSWLTCVGLGCLAFTFSTMAMLSAILLGTQRSRSRRTKNLNLRDSMALIFLGGHPANFTLGVIAVWFGTENLHAFLPTTTCTNLVAVGVASQWNVAFSIPVVTIYYALLLRCHGKISQPAVNSRRESRQSRDLSRPEDEIATGETSGEKSGFCTHRVTLSVFRSSAGVVILVGVVNMITLVAAHYSLSYVVQMSTVRDILDEQSPPLHSFCGRFLTKTELFPRRTIALVFMVAAGITSGAIISLSLELDGRGKRHRRVATSPVSAVDTARLRSFTRPPDEGAHFHHYADPPLLPPPHRFGDGNDEFDSEEGNVVPGEGGENRRGMMVGFGSAVEGVGSPGSSTTIMQWSDNEFYDPERTRHIVQSPPPPDFNQRAHSRRTPSLFQSNIENHRRSSQLSVAMRANTLPTNFPVQANPNRRSRETSRSGPQLSNQRGSTADLATEDTRRSTNENARSENLDTPPHPAVLSSSSSGFTDRATLPDGDRHDAHARETDNMWRRLVEIVFPHRQSGRNRQRFRHTKVEHVREDILPPSHPTSPPSRNSATTASSPDVPLPLIVTCNNVCVTGALFVFTYTIVAVYLLMTADAPLSRSIPGHFSFIASSFEPIMALLLTKATLDSVFFLLALLTLTPVFFKI